MHILPADPGHLEDRQKSRVRRAWQFLVDHGALEVWRLARQHGLGQCARFVIRNLRYMLASTISRSFDRLHAVDTAGEIPNTHLRVIGEQAAQGAFFLSTPAWSFRRILANLPHDLSDFAFVDFGCGKGRTLLLAAAARNFRQVIGVEHAPALVTTAKHNIARWRGARRCRDIRAVCADATKFELPPDPCVLYFFAPFDRPVLDSVLANIARSYRGRPRRLTAIYVAALEEQLPDDAMLAAGMRRVSTPRCLPRFDPGASRPLHFAIYEFQ